jgi:hypothetical protein
MSSILLDISIVHQKKVKRRTGRGNRILSHLHRQRRKNSEPKLIFIDEPYLDYMKRSYGDLSLQENMWNEGRYPRKSSK